MPTQAAGLDDLDHVADVWPLHRQLASQDRTDASLRAQRTKTRLARLASAGDATQESPANPSSSDCRDLEVSIPSCVRRHAPARRGRRRPNHGATASPLWLNAGPCYSDVDDQGNPDDRDTAAPPGGDDETLRQLWTESPRPAHVLAREGPHDPQHGGRLDGSGEPPPYTDRNPGGQLPALELDDGLVIGETVAIFEYLEEKHPKPPLIGTTPEERAETRMWQRRIELRITEHLYNGFRFAEGLELFRPRMRVLPEAAEGLKATVCDNLAWLDALMAGKQFVVGPRFTVADIILYAALDFGSTVGQALDTRYQNLTAWLARAAARPSAAASLHPSSAAIGMRG